MPAETLTPKNYRPRLIEGRLDTLMKAFGCVEITGARWCGKTWTALSRSASVTKLDEPAEREAATVDPKLALLGERPHLVDEWQEVPTVWDAARRYVDDSGNARGSLLLTGSTSLPADKRKDVRHSGTGRIARLTMRPMALCESGDSTAEVSLRSLLEGEELAPARCSTDVEDIARLCCRGGWPANIGMPDEVALETAGQYVRSALDVNVTEQRRSPEIAEALMRALAVNEGQAATYKTLAKDMAGEGRGVDDDTIASYLDLFGRIHLIEQLHGWEPPMGSKSRVRVKPKRSFVDPSLAAALLHATPSRLLRDTQTLGLLFESLVLRDLRVFLSTYPGLGNGVCYYRDDKGLEVDAIIEYEGRWAGIEVKLSDAKIDEGARSLNRLRDRMSANGAARNAEPVFLAVVVGKGSLAYTRDDGVMVIPATLLGA
ncbi:AAA family ATPase [Gordonibacter sp. An232A]|nr:AAA family ATPase [Gordonibacter sp. An232A]